MVDVCVPVEVLRWWWWWLVVISGGGSGEVGSFH